MARVTVEDCVQKIPNRFELVVKSSRRAREISSGSPLTVERDNDKNPVIALREIADETISLDELHEAIVKGHQKVIEVEEDEEEMIDLMEGEHEWAGVAQEAADTEHALEGAGMHEEIASEEGAGDLAAEEMQELPQE